MSRHVWGYSSTENRLYCFQNKAFRTNYLDNHADVEEIQAQDSFVQDMRTYSVKWGKSHAIRDFISPNSPIQDL